MKIVLLSDTHNLLSRVVVPDGDLLIHCGDATNRGTLPEFEKFISMFASLPHKNKVFIAGNHDWNWQRNKNESLKILSKYPGVNYLEDSMVEIDGLKIYGSPFQPAFCSWAFNLPRGNKLREVWEKIPSGIDILVTHGPPFETLDWTYSNERVGCLDLQEELERIKPKINCFGHIHESYGITEKNGIIYCNCSLLGYDGMNEPFVVDLA